MFKTFITIILVFTINEISVSPNENIKDKLEQEFDKYWHEVDEAKNLLEQKRLQQHLLPSKDLLLIAINAREYAAFLKIINQQNLELEYLKLCLKTARENLLKDNFWNNYNEWNLSYQIEADQNIIIQLRQKIRNINKQRCCSCLFI